MHGFRCQSFSGNTLICGIITFVQTAGSPNPGGLVQREDLMIAHLACSEFSAATPEWEWTRGMWQGKTSLITQLWMMLMFLYTFNNWSWEYFSAIVLHPNFKAWSALVFFVWQWIFVEFIPPRSYKCRTDRMCAAGFGVQEKHNEKVKMTQRLTTVDP